MTCTAEDELPLVHTLTSKAKIRYMSTPVALSCVAMVTTYVFHRSFDLTMKSNRELLVSASWENERDINSSPHAALPHPHPPPTPSHLPPSLPHPYILIHSHAQLLLALQNNSLELHLLTPSTHPVTSSLHSAITAPGHRSDIRYTLSLPPPSS